MYRLSCIGATALAGLAAGACSRTATPVDSGNTYANGSRTKREMIDRTLYDSPEQRAEVAEPPTSGRSWNDHDVTVDESELSAAARNTLSQESDGAPLAEVGRTVWDGKQAYSCKVMKNGHFYRVVADSDGTILTTRRLD